MTNKLQKYYIKYLSSHNIIDKQIYLHKIIYHSKKTQTQTGGEFTKRAIEFIKKIEDKINSLCTNKFIYEITIPDFERLSSVELNISILLLLVSSVIYSDKNVISKIGHIFSTKNKDEKNINKFNPYIYIVITYFDVIKLFTEPESIIIEIAKKTISKNMLNINNNLENSTKKIITLLKSDEFNNYLEHDKELNTGQNDDPNTTIEEKNINSYLKYLNVIDKNLDEKIKEINLKIKQAKLDKYPYEELENKRLEFINNKKRNKTILGDININILNIKHKNQLLIQYTEILNNIEKQIYDSLPLEEIKIFINSKKNFFTENQLKYIEYIIKYIYWCEETYPMQKPQFDQCEIGKKLEDSLLNKIVSDDENFKEFIFTNVFIEDPLGEGYKGEFDFVIGETKDGKTEVYKIYDAKNTGNAITHDVYLFENSIKHIQKDNKKLKILDEIVNIEKNTNIKKGYLINIPFDKIKYINSEIVHCFTDFIKTNIDSLSNSQKINILKCIGFDVVIDNEYRYFYKINDLLLSESNIVIFNFNFYKNFKAEYDEYFTLLNKKIQILKHYDIKYCNIENCV